MISTKLSKIVTRDEFLLATEEELIYDIYSTAPWLNLTRIRCLHQSE